MPDDSPSDLRDYVVDDPALHGQAKSVASFMLGLAQLSRRIDAADDTMPDNPPSDLRDYVVVDDPALRGQAKSVASAVLGFAQRLPLSRAALLARVCGSAAVEDAHRQLDNTALTILSLTCAILGSSASSHI